MRALPLPLLLLVLFLVPCLRAGEAPAVAPKAGRDQFVFTHRGHAILVLSYVPPAARVDAPVVIAMHGFGRGAEPILEDFIPFARERGFIVIVPRFTAEEYPNDFYIAGGVLDKAGRLRPHEDWTFASIDSLFDATLARLGCRTPGYFLVGHSAGSQFVHRFVWLVHTPKLLRAVISNAGWYSLPELSQPYPYGLGNTPAKEQDLRVAFGVRLSMLQGANDTDPNGLRHTPEADAQGPNRLERGRLFFAQCQARARSLNTPFNWTHQVVPMKSHSDVEIIPYYVACLFGADTQP